MRTFVGYDGHYEIYDSGRIILKLASNAKKISNDADRNGVLHLVQVMRLYKTILQR